MLEARRDSKIFRRRWPAALALAVLSLSSVASAGSSQSHGRVGLYVSGGEGSGQALPLEHTAVEGYLSGFAAEIETKQVYSNPFRRPIEVVYVFPLPERAAVTSMKARIGNRTIVRKVMSREGARKKFLSFRAKGYTTAMLEQERPNVFTQTVTQLQPGEKIELTLAYSTILRHDRGQYELALPSVVAPRHVPGTANGRMPSGGGTAPDTDRVPDGSRVTPPTLERGMRSGRSLSVVLHVSAASAIKFLNSPTHLIKIERPSNQEATVRLAKKDVVPNEDFVLRYRLANENVSFVLLSGMEKRGGFFSLLSEPPAWSLAPSVVKKEVVIVVDASSSMAGAPLSYAKDLARHAIRTLNRGDQFRVVALGQGGRRLAQGALPVASSNTTRALKFIDGLSAHGASDLSSSLGDVLAHGYKRSTIVVVVTDGLVANEDEVFSVMSKMSKPNVRVFPVGVGSSPNRHLIEGMALRGRGLSDYLLLAEATSERIVAIVDRIRWPLLTNVTIDWGGLSVTDVHPERLSDLYLGAPVFVMGRYAKPGRAEVVVSGLMGKKSVSYRVPVELSSRAGNRVLPSLWAQHAISEIERSAASPRLAKQRIISHAIEHGLVTQYTSFVAVDSVPSSPGKARVLQIPVELARGLLRDKATEAPENLPEKAAPSPGEQDDGDSLIETSTEATIVSASAWQVGAGLGLGLTDLNGSDGLAALGRFNLHADRQLSSRWSVGLETAALLSFGGETSGVFSLLGQFKTKPWSPRWALGVALGPAVTSYRDAGVAACVALSWIAGTALSIELRYDRTQLFKSDEGGDRRLGQDPNSASLGLSVEF